MSIYEAIERIQAMRSEEALSESDEQQLPEHEYDRRWVQQETFDRCLDVLQLVAVGLEPMQGSAR